VIASYNWNFGNGTSSPITHPQTTFANYGNYTVSLTAVSNQNCVGSNSSTVSVHPNPNINFSSTTTCFNQSTQFTNNSTIAAGAIVKYKWDFDDNGSWEDSTANPSFIYPGPGTISCRLYGISNNGCTGFKVNPVIVHDNPVASLQAPSTCLGDNTPFTNLSTSSDGAITTYLWDFNGDNVTDNVNTNPVHSYNTYGVYLTKLEVQTQYGCTHVISKSVYVNPKPVAQFSVKNNIGCPDLCTEFTNSSTIAKGSIVTHQWQFGDGTLPVYTQSPVHCYRSGIYSVILKVVSDSGCISTLTMPNIINAYPAPIADFNVTPEQVDINEPVVSVTSNASGASFTQYYLGDGSVYEKNNFTHSFNISEPQKIAIFQYVKNEYGCSDTIARVIDIKPSYVIYIPNAFTPNADGLNDQFQAKGHGIHKFKMQIFDRWGHVIFESEDLNDAWDGTVKGSSDPIKNDVYVWKAQVEDVFHQNHQLNGHVTLMK
jgi:gliding motility-associated-like protein